MESMDVMEWNMKWNHEGRNEERRRMTNFKKN